MPKQPKDYRNSGKILDYARNAVVVRLRVDGYKIAPGFDPITDKDVT